MVDLEERVLQRLDGWFAKQISGNYTNELNGDTISFFMSAFAINTEDLRGTTSPEAASTIVNFSKKGFIAFYQHFFTVQYRLIKGAVAIFPSETVPDKARGLYQEYIQGALESPDRLTSFVESVGTKCEGKSPDELTDAEIEDSFVQVYPTPKHFSDNIIYMLESADLAKEPFRRFGIDMGSESEEYEKCEKAAKEWLPYMVSKLFGGIFLSRLPHSDYWTQEDVGRQVGFRAYDGTYRTGTVIGVKSSYGSRIDPIEIRNAIVFDEVGDSKPYNVTLRKANQRPAKNDFGMQGNWCFIDE